MDPLRAVIFVDGQNFKKNLQEFRFAGFADGKDFRLDEKHFLWDQFFRDVLKKFTAQTCTEYRLIRTYWYNADSVSSWYTNHKLIQTIVAKYKPKFPDITETLVIDLAQKWYDRNKKNFFEGRDRVYEVIQKEVDFVEFKYIGQYKLKPYDVYKFEKDPLTGEYIYFGTREGEKGVDIGLAIDMVSKMVGFDVAILVSGDADFYPAVRYVKDHLKQVFQFSVAKGVPPNISYLSPWLKGIVDVFAFFDETELLGKYLNKKASIPGIVMRSIEKRLSDLAPQAQPIVTPITKVPIVTPRN